MGRAITKEAWLVRAVTKHGDKYDYSGVEFKILKDKVTIGCPIHGNFTQAAGKHLVSGCAKCSGNVRLTKEEFVKKANEKHNSLYTYDSVKYVNADTKVSITCSIHGDFKQSPHKHADVGRGCPKCAAEIKARRKIAQYGETFVKRATEKHNGLYTYEKSVYICNSPLTLLQRFSYKLNGVFKYCFYI